MKRPEAFFRQHKAIAKWVILAFFAVISCCGFPLFNLTHRLTGTLDFTFLFVNGSLYFWLGATSAMVFREKKLPGILSLHLAVILSGMVLRFLLEFGEVSNIYNFTLPNIALHIPVTLGISTLSWLRSRK